MDRPGKHRVATVLAMSVTIVMIGMCHGQEQTIPPAAKADPKINEPFKRPDLKAFVKRFESDDREVFTRRKEIVRALGLTPGMSVADVGAGTGLFTRLFADKVGTKGKVFAVDISTQFLAHIATLARKDGQTQIITVQGSQVSANLPAQAVDLVFLCDVYHHLENPRESLLSMRNALKPGGKLVVIDFDRVEGRSEDFVLKHVRASKDVFRKEIESAGFRLLPPDGAPDLKENFFLRFEKPTSPQRSQRDRGDEKEFR